MIFVDTSAWFASIVPSDTDHQIASLWVNQNTEQLITTDYIIDETLTLLRTRGEFLRAISLKEAFFSDVLTTIYYLTEEDIRQTWQIFRQFSDKNWSFTNCASRVVMNKFHLTQAFTFDHYLRQFRFVNVVP
ncbi:type II toxin-antitoxin system VapC family toxin [Nostoc sp. 'Peltigera malacea cyanobiont' DB3992]|uniref:type II toxin-antitoxin system VapC family toxin n=1 Tax=Nostoc sp. 'Peltigera malacea cyanobiont' DB3992 TaxID=1206980 RepID=UPI000C056E29|nr:PIN domain-containing protein [Nostoc sp. 'Peltigera malacea cyanobiont' DB3992]PHM06532.1 DNA-binding protein [Nostoc sp. 'Peltigera malacea cyanobiont' DB3992]